MKKNVARLALTVALLLGVLNLIAFVVPFARTPVFWLAYAFTSAAIVAQLPLSLYAFSAKGGARNSLYGFSIARLATLYLLAQSIIGLLNMAMGAWIPFWVALVIEVVMLVLAVIGCMATTAIRDEIQRQDVALQRDVSVMRELQSRTGALVGQAQGSNVQELLRKLADDFRFSDPVSSAVTASLESDLRANMDDLERAINDGDTDGVLELCRRTSALLAERIRLCKLNK